MSDNSRLSTRRNFLKNAAAGVIGTYGIPYLVSSSALGASALASCKSQGYRRREGNKRHNLGKSKDSRVKVGGKKIKGKKYGGPLPDWS